MSGVNFPTYYEEHEAQQSKQPQQQQPQQPPQPPQPYMDPIQLHPLLNMPIPKGVEYMTIEDPNVGSGWGDTLVYHLRNCFQYCFF